MFKPASPRQSRQSKRFHAARSDAARSSGFHGSQFHSSQFKPSQFRTTQAHGWNDERGDDSPSEFRRLETPAPRGGSRTRTRGRGALSGTWLVTAMVLAVGCWALVQWVPMLHR